MFPEEHVIYRYKYLPYSDGSLKTLSDGTIKFTCPSDFNDPFDCRPYYDPTSIDDLPKTRPDLIQAAAKELGWSRTEALQRQAELVNWLRRDIENGSFGKGLISKIGVVSLSKNPVNILMWSHYADFHRGFVLEFRIPTAVNKVNEIDLATERLLPLSVTYRKERPPIKFGDRENLQQNVEHALLTKSEDWHYEDEERVIDHVRGPGIHRYRRDEILSSVIAGINIGDNLRDLKSLVSPLAERSSIRLKLYEARIKKGKFALEVPDHPRIGAK